MFDRRGCRVAVVLLAGLMVRAWAAETVPDSVAAQPAPSRGELLYATHCVECHAAQIHWREHKLAHNWPTLRDQVDHWQRIAWLDWSARDVDAVARYLNETIYGFSAPVISRRNDR
ncbi:MAG TPA: cytochrome C [Ramlibacter sp.]|nr:cytochrome C [Ramlibacter sp.]